LPPFISGGEDAQRARRTANTSRGATRTLAAALALAAAASAPALACAPSPVGAHKDFAPVEVRLGELVDRRERLLLGAKAHDADALGPAVRALEDFGVLYVSSARKVVLEPLPRRVV